ncbi:hypothetical protein MAP00_002134 [Monascus purpureus]|nr:hypothetical protein MAP00_002134 [Monascus purpureus]
MPGCRIISCASLNATQFVTNETTCDVSSQTGFFIPRIALSFGGGRNGKTKLRFVYLLLPDNGLENSALDKKKKTVSDTFYIFAFAFLCRAPCETCGRHTLVTTYNPTFSLHPWASTPPQFL